MSPRALEGPALDRSEFAGVVVEVFEGDLFDELGQVDAIVNPWNRNVIPRWLLIPGGVSGRLKVLTGPKPWKELAKLGGIPLGGAVLTDGGQLPVEIIHAAGISLRWRATEASVADATSSSVRIALQRRHRVVAAPVIGAGHGGLDQDLAASAMLAALTDRGARQGDEARREGRLTFRIVTRS